MNPLITISIPVYNVEKYVEKSLSSALNQTYDNLEILVIDDKGTDNSMDVVRSIIARHPRGNVVKIIDHGINQGTGATKNSAIDNANGKYIFFMDSDDYISLDCIEKLYSRIYETNAEIVVGSYDCFDYQQHFSKGKSLKEFIYCNINAYFRFLKMPECYIQTWNKLYNLDFLRRNKIRCIPSNTYEDIYFSFQLLAVTNSVATIADITYHYRLDNSNSVTASLRTGNLNMKMINQIIDVLKHIYTEIEHKRYAINYPAKHYFFNQKMFLIGYIVNNCNDKPTMKKLINSIGSYPLVEKDRFNFLHWELLLNQLFTGYHSYLIYSNLRKISKKVKSKL